METIRVNMTPCEDIKTIHASQNDNEAREWGFELHNNGEKIDSSSISDQLVFKAYEGGTEEILPTNGSTPTTSPFKGDIKYPQGLLSGQEFLYRESPTEEDGLAKITDIKGNTLIWNQLSPSKAFASSYSKTGLTFVPNDDGSVSISGTVNGTDYNFYVGGIVPVIQGHKYLVKGNSTHFGASYYSSLVAINEYNTGGVIATASATGNAVLYIRGNLTNGASINETIYPQIFDLTQMGLDITDPSDFTSLFPLPYYAYNQGTLLSFMGNGIKTVSKNQFNTQIVSPSTTVGTTLTKGDGSIRLQYTGTGRYTGFNFMNPNGGLVSDWANKLLLKKKYRLSFDFGGAEVAWTCGLRTASANSFVGSITMQNQGHYSLTLNLDTMTEDVYISWARTGNSTNPFDVTVSNIQLELGTTETSYEPYTSSTLSLPISTYFPNGMKSAGSVYDELTETKAITRVGSVTLNGTETWHEPDSSGNCWMDFDNMPVVTDYRLTMTATVTVAKNRQSMATNSVTGYNSGTTNYLYFRTADATQSVANVKAYLQANPVTLNYELKTQTETSFITASLVTENAEIPLSNEDGVLIGKCTEQLSSESGFFDAKIKLADEDGECYSNKIQLHIERSPQ